MTVVSEIFDVRTYVVRIGRLGDNFSNAYQASKYQSGATKVVT